MGAFVEAVQQLFQIDVAGVCCSAEDCFQGWASQARLATRFEPLWLFKMAMLYIVYNIYIHIVFLLTARDMFCRSSSHFNVFVAQTCSDSLPVRIVNPHVAWEYFVPRRICLLFPTCLPLSPYTSPYMAGWLAVSLLPVLLFQHDLNLYSNFVFKPPIVIACICIDCNVRGLRSPSTGCIITLVFYMKTDSPAALFSLSTQRRVVWWHALCCYMLLCCCCCALWLCSLYAAAPQKVFLCVMLEVSCS